MDREAQMQTQAEGDAFRELTGDNGILLDALGDLIDMLDHYRLTDAQIEKQGNGREDRLADLRMRRAVTLQACDSLRSIMADSVYQPGNLSPREAAIASGLNLASKYWIDSRAEVLVAERSSREPDPEFLIAEQQRRAA